MKRQATLKNPCAVNEMSGQAPAISLDVPSTRMDFAKLLVLFLAFTLLSDGTVRAQDLFQTQRNKEGGVGGALNNRPSLALPRVGTPSLGSLPQIGPSATPFLAKTNSLARRLLVERRNDFQIFLRESAGLNLPIFGQDLFQDVPDTFAPVENIPVTPDYAVGPGDEILIRGWGQVDIDLRATVDRTGSIQIPKVGNVTVTGLKFQELQPFLKAQIGRIFQNFDLNVNLGQLRSIQVFVVGQAQQPGNYTISSLSTLVNAIFASGGPSSSGSMRGIQLKRGNKVVTELDLYDLLLNGDKSKDVPLLPGDVIYIPPIGSLVAVASGVNVPAIYEIKEKTTLEDVLKWGGGLTTTANGRKATIERIQDRKVRKVDEFTLDKAGLQQALQDGDMVKIYAVSPRFDNVVTIRGNVADPMHFPWKEGVRVKDLIPEKEVLIPRLYWIKRNALSQFSGLSSSDSRRPDDSRRFEEEARGGDGRQGRNQEEFRNDLKRSLTEVNWDYAAIERFNPGDLTTKLIPFNLGKAILKTDPEHNLALQPGDVITIFSKSDIAQPLEKQSKYVRLEGEASGAGLYQMEPGETLRHLLTRTGGLTTNAYLYAVVFTRESTRADQQKRQDEALARMEMELERAGARLTAAALSAESAAAEQLQLENRRRLLQSLKAMKPSGRIVLEIPRERGDIKQLPELVLEDGDRIFIPSTPSVVSVFGSVYNQNTFVHQSSRTVSDYLSQAGGVTRDGDKSEMFLIRANGSVLSRNSTGWGSSFASTRMMPGDTLVVPEQLERTNIMRELKDWAQILYQIGLGAAAIKVLQQ